MSVPFPTHTRPGRRGLPADVVAAMHADYLALGSYGATGRKWNRTAGTIRDVLRVRGLVQTDPDHSRRASAQRRCNGTFVAGTPATPEQVEAMIAGLDRMKIPSALRWEWREWSHAQRSAFVRKLRSKFPSQRPTSPFSANVTPFDYTSPLAHELAAKLNAGHNSQTMPVKLKLASEGVIWRGQLYFWSAKIGYQPGPFDPVKGRPALHHLIWEHHHGRSVPAQTTVIFLDGNKNNLAPENLGLRAMADCVRINRREARLKKSRVLTGLLVTRFEQATHESKPLLSLVTHPRRNDR